MKHIKHINELFNLNTLATRAIFGKDFVKDQDIAEGILKSVKSSKIIVTSNGTVTQGEGELISNVDGFNISAFKAMSSKSGRAYYELNIDGVNMNCTTYITKKIWDYFYQIFTSDDDYTRKDARIHFSKKR